MICVIGEIVRLSIAVYASWTGGFNRKNARSPALHNEETAIERKWTTPRPAARCRELTTEAQRLPALRRALRLPRPHQLYRTRVAQGRHACATDEGHKSNRPKGFRRPDGGWLDRYALWRCRRPPRRRHVSPSSRWQTLSVLRGGGAHDQSTRRRGSRAELDG